MPDSAGPAPGLFGRFTGTGLISVMAWRKLAALHAVIVKTISPRRDHLSFPAMDRKRASDWQKSVMADQENLGYHNRIYARIYFPGTVTTRTEVCTMECARPAKIGKAQVQEIQALEEKLGVTLVAYEKIPVYKKLTKTGIAKLQAAEKETGAILVAYEA
jgi:hypothetical protein